MSDGSELRAKFRPVSKCSGVGAHFENLARKYVRSCGWCFLLVFVVPRHLEPVVPARSAVFLQILSIQVKDENELWTIKT